MFLHFGVIATLKIVLKMMQITLLGYIDECSRPWNPTHVL